MVVLKMSIWVKIGTQQNLDVVDNNGSIKNEYMGQNRSSTKF